MGQYNIPCEPDVVTILWYRNPLDRCSSKRIADACVLGSADPCSCYLKQGKKLRCAEECLLENGFERLCKESFDVYGVSTYIRKH